MLKLRSTGQRRNQDRCSVFFDMNLPHFRTRFENLWVKSAPAEPVFFFLAAKYGGINSGWCIYGGNHPHLLRNVFWRQKKNPEHNHLFCAQVETSLIILVCLCVCVPRYVAQVSIQRTWNRGGNARCTRHKTCTRASEPNPYPVDPQLDPLHHRFWDSTPTSHTLFT
jgi:hypothetical protein